jgi:glycosyltransferase involved in cell wall biosynthesis
LLPINRLRDLTAIPRVVRYLSQHRADLVHTQLEFSNTLGNLAAKLLGLPSVSTIHTHQAPLKGTKEFRRLRLMWWSMRKFCDRVIAVAEETRGNYLAVSRDAPHKVITIYNGIDLSSFRPVDATERARQRERLGIPEQAPLIITVAMLRQKKGIQYMIDAFPTILESIPGAHYLIVGDGDYRPALHELAVRRGLSERITLAGLRYDIPDLLGTSDLFVLPSLDEALPTVLAEAMAARRPVIASAIGGIPEMVADGVNGLLLPPGEPTQLAQACIRLLNNPDLAAKMGAAGWEIANQRFNIRTQAQQTGDLYWELLETAGR